MGTTITASQNIEAANECLEAINARFSGSGIVASVEHHSNAKNQNQMQDDRLKQNCTH